MTWFTLKSENSTYHDLLKKSPFISEHTVTGHEYEAILCYPFGRHERIIKPTCWECSQDDEVVVAKYVTKQRDYKDLCISSESFQSFPVDRRLRVKCAMLFPLGAWYCLESLIFAIM